MIYLIFHHSRRVIEQCENKLSKLKEDLVNTKEALNRALLENEVLDQEKRDISEALSKSEICKAELELEINKVKTEEASLRDALLKMQALNEGLGQDKIELNKIIMQVCCCWCQCKLQSWSDLLGLSRCQ